MKKVAMFSVILFFLSFSFVLQAQNASSGKSSPDNSDRKFFYDLGLETGLYVSTTDRDWPSGSILSFHGGYYWNDRFGVRSGLSFISGLEGSDRYYKVPLLFSFRIGPYQKEWDDRDEYDNFGELLFAFLLHFLPTSLEVNAGTSFGSISPDLSEIYTINNKGKEILSERSWVSREFASSLDANLRLSFRFWRINLTGNMGINYLYTKNFHHTLYVPEETRNRPCWFANLGLGASFLF